MTSGAATCGVFHLADRGKDRQSTYKSAVQVASGRFSAKGMNFVSKRFAGGGDSG